MGVSKAGECGESEHVIHISTVDPEVSGRAVTSGDWMLLLFCPSSPMGHSTCLWASVTFLCWMEDASNGGMPVRWHKACFLYVIAYRVTNPASDQSLSSCYWPLSGRCVVRPAERMWSFYGVVHYHRKERPSPVMNSRSKRFIYLNRIYINRFS